MEHFLSPEVLAFVSVVLIDLVLSADNGLIVGLAAASLSPKNRKKAIAIGIVLATLFRLLFAGIAIELLKIPGMLLIGGVLLLYVSYKMWGDLRGEDHPLPKKNHVVKKQTAAKGKKSFASALWQITLADISMSLDNVLAVAGASREHPIIMAFGLGLSIVLMATVATMIASLLKKYPVIGYAGLAVVIYIAAKLTYQGANEVIPLVMGWL
ncbi:MAG: YjbE family putative metal transport protein [Hydrotalea sp.]|nr:YjbE family putative metal transport protein [Hydrotalea sp.]